jgi:class 3 adenylate cyclase
MAVDMRTEVTKLAADWSRRGHDLAFGVGVANGPVCNLAARLCSEAKAGQILVSKRVHGRIEQHVVAEPLGELALKGFHRNVQAFNVTGLKPA